jgi:1-acyl-sn-glycerol-3-phosphate acyltransferase
MAWFHAPLPVVARAAAFVYYRITYGGEPVPAAGPVLLVANHPNSLMDPTLVLAAARRPVRFLAKAPLFRDVKTAWLVRLAGAIPLYRRSDDPAQMDRNQDAFRAVYAALAEGAAVGIFPEGLSHSDPSLAPLKTGAARMALGAHEIAGRTFPIIPLGLVFDRKDVFRSGALVLAGAPVPWDDLAPRGLDDADAVHALTERVAEALRRVTVNLEAWNDRPLVECAVRIWEAEQRVPPDRAARIGRLEITTRLLAEVRRGGDAADLALADDVDAFRRRLERLRLRPADLGADVGITRGLVWAVGRIQLVFPLAIGLALVGFLVFYPPYRLTGMIVDRAHLEEDQRSSWKLLVGMGVYAVWVVMAAGAMGAIGAMGTTGTNVGRAVGVAAAVLLGMPAVGMLGLLVRERWRGAWRDARRFFRLRSRHDLVAQLRDERRALGARLDALLARLTIAKPSETA